jgi:hypothetical protein
MVHNGTTRPINQRISDVNLDIKKRCESWEN